MNHTMNNFTNNEPTRRSAILSYRCFYCDLEVDVNELHMVSFNIMDDERDEVLCDECYREWLEGQKG